MYIVIILMHSFKEKERYMIHLSFFAAIQNAFHNGILLNTGSVTEARLVLKVYWFVWVAAGEFMYSEIVKPGVNREFSPPPPPPSKCALSVNL
jgi:hypothetical protein